MPHSQTILSQKIPIYEIKYTLAQTWSSIVELKHLPLDFTQQSEAASLLPSNQSKSNHDSLSEIAQTLGDEFRLAIWAPVKVGDQLALTAKWENQLLMFEFGTNS